MTGAAEHHDIGRIFVPEAGISQVVNLDLLAGAAVFAASAASA